jgi:predicted Rdx family selenoprotein
VSAEIKEVVGGEVTLVGGEGGIFEIRRDGEVLWAKERGGAFPAAGEAAALFEP